jgi:hypothetical protein
MKQDNFGQQQMKMKMNLVEKVFQPLRQMTLYLEQQLEKHFQVKIQQ